MARPTAFKKDGFRRVRGGNSRWLLVHCEKCQTPVLVYQKDGPGMLKRLYVDRIVAPRSLADLQNLSIKRLPNLVCAQCKTILGVPYVYEKEQRSAFRLFVGAVGKKIVKGEKVEDIRV